MRKRPVFLNLLQIKLPPAGMVSIAHRVSGLLLVLSAPILIYLFALSLQSAAGFAQTKTVIANGWFKIFLMLLCWAIAHHLLAGIRFLLLDIDIGMTKDVANQSAMGVMFLGIILAISLFLGLI